MGSSQNADSKVIWMDGELIPYEEAKVPVLSHTLHYGTGVFEGIRAYQTSRNTTAMFRADDHFVRFQNSIRVLGCVSHYAVSDLVKASSETIRANGFKECYIRPIAYLNDSFRGLQLPEKPSMKVAIATWAWGKYLGSSSQQDGIKVMVSSFRRYDVSTFMPHAKITGNYVPSVMARREATQNKLAEAIMLDAQGYVAEGTGENLFLIKGKNIFTTPQGSILPGITRDSAIQIANHLGYEVREVPITRNELYLADELFFTGTAVEVTPIVEVDRFTIGDGRPGPVTKSILAAFFNVVKGESQHFREWLTEV